LRYAYQLPVTKSNSNSNRTTSNFELSGEPKFVGSLAVANKTARDHLLVYVPSKIH